MNTTNSTTPEVIGWAPEPDGRGTLGLLWSCFATVFICTWSAIHPNVPPDGRTKTQQFWDRVVLLLGATVAPEWFTSIAYNDFHEARALKKELGGWSLSQCFFLEMGGFCVQLDPEVRNGGIRMRHSELIKLWEEGSVPKPTIDASDFDDRNKADWVIKSIALMQVLWFALQLIGRAAQGLPVTTLELFTASIVYCTSITYLLWWEKPFDIRKPIVLYPSTDKSKHPRRWPKDIKRIALSDGESNRKIHSTFQFAMISTMVLIFGGLHLVAWQFHFPTSAERWIWRGASIASMMLPFITWFCVEVLDQDLLGSFSCGLYFLVRAYLFVEMLVGLRSVQVGVYQGVEWSSYFPAFG